MTAEMILNNPSLMGKEQEHGENCIITRVKSLCLINYAMKICMGVEV
jgi:hypothetical protein